MTRHSISNSLGHNEAEPRTANRSQLTSSCLSVKMKNDGTPSSTLALPNRCTELFGIAELVL